jgi:hypothetical protein
MSEPADIFYKTFVEFLDDLNKIQPEDSSLLLVKASLYLISSETLVRNFMYYVGEYSDQILARDEAFFIEELPSKLEDSSYALGELSRVIKIWNDPETTQDSKNCIWDYFTILIKLGNRVICE